jgi:hypothetical protein
VLSILEFVENGAAPLVGQHRQEIARGFLSFLCGLSITSGSFDMVSPDGRFVDNIWFLLSIGHVAIEI